MANSLSEFGKVVFVHIKVSLVSGTGHIVGGNKKNSIYTKGGRETRNTTTRLLTLTHVSRYPPSQGRAH